MTVKDDQIELQELGSISRDTNGIGINNLDVEGLLDPPGLRND